MRRYLGAVLALSLLAAGAAGEYADLYFVDSQSMSPTLQAGDIVLCVRSSKLARGDVVIFAHQTGAVGVKHLVGLPGDELSYLRKELTLNKQQAPKQRLAELGLEEPADVLFAQQLGRHSFHIQELYGASLHEVAPAALSGYFFLGDNRDDSVDSREFGVLPGAAIRCKAQLVLARTTRGLLDLRGMRKIS